MSFPWSGRSGTSYSQMEIIEGRKLVAHRSVFVRFPLIDKENEYLLVWTTTPWTLTSNIAAAVNVDLDYLKLQAHDGSIYYFAKENFKFKRLEKQFKDKKQWVEGVPKLKTLEQMFKERGEYKILDTVKGKDLIGLKYKGPFDELEAQSIAGGFPFTNKNLEKKGVTAIDCHKVIDGGKDSRGNDVVVAGEGTGIVHIATGCGAIDNKIGKKIGLVEIAPLNEESKYINGFGHLSGKLATDQETTDIILNDLKEKSYLVHIEKYPHVYPHCWRSGDELVYRSVDEWYINMDWRDEIKKLVGDINWIPDWGHDREMEWLDNMGDWMISKKRFWGLALPVWTFEDGSFYVVGSKKELEELAVEGWEDFKGKTPHRPWIDKVKIKHPKTGLIGTRIEDVGNPWLDAGIVPYSTLNYNENRKYWEEWFPPDFVVECFPGQFRNWFYSLLSMSAIMESKIPFKTLLGHALVKDATGRDMHKSWGNAIWFDDAAEKMGVDTMRWLYASQNPEHNLLFGYSIADEIRKNIITLWNTYSFFITYASLDNFIPQDHPIEEKKLNELDHWIIAKINNFIQISDDYYSSYELYKLMKESSRILDDISNWYVRRNRRRFWRSENDDDKMSAYSTLYYVLVRYIKVLSPVVPFISDKIYENLVSNIDSSKPRSIHLTNFPKVDSIFLNEDLVAEIDCVKEIVSLGRSARNKVNLKIRQPLSEILIYVHNNNNIEKYKQQIIDELNVKNLIIVDDDKSIVKYEVKPNFSVLGQRFGKDLQSIIKEINLLSYEKIISELDLNKSIKIFDHVLTKEEINIIESPYENYSLSTSSLIKVAINIKLDESLIEEGIVRDFIRAVQNHRKESNFEVDDRIDLNIVCNDSFFLALENNLDYFKSETLCKKIIRKKSINGGNTLKISSQNVELAIKRL